jgi:hypothetical protein
MRILCCLLSDQHVPNLLSVHHFQPDRLVLVESAAMKKRNAAAHFLNALKLGGLNYDERSEIEPLQAEDSLECVRQALRHAYGKYPSATWIANLTGGTKPMSIATYELFKAQDGRLVYTNVERPAEFSDITTGQTECCQHKLTIKEFLAGYGFESRKADDKIKEAENRASQWAECARVIATNTTAGDLLPLSDEERRRGRRKGLQLQPGQLQLPDDHVAAVLADTWQLTGNGRASLAGKLNEYQVEFLTGGWLEVFFWGLLARHADALSIWDVRLGLEVGRVGDSSGNDFDVAFMHNYGLEMIECKSGGQEYDSGGDILYKVEAVTRQFRALRAKSYLATTGTNVVDGDGRIKSAIANRAEIYNCRLLTAADIRNLAAADSAEVVKTTLFGADGRL